MIKNLGIIDYGSGNIHSLKCALEKIGANVKIITNDTQNNIDALFIPGVGSFDNAIHKLSKMQLDKYIKKFNDDKKIIIGICLGMQIMVEEGIENGICEGLKLLSGKTYKLPYKDKEKYINIGWKKTNFINQKHLESFNNEKFYYVHSFAVNTEKKYINSISNFNEKKFISGISKDNLEAFQFHPEKSGDLGLDLLKSVLAKF
jgi:imidazole glycerol-phosphate synthase subunit HisH